MHIMLFWHKRKIDHFKPYNVFLAIATNPSVLLMTGFVVQGHIYYVRIILFLIWMDLLLLHQYLMVQYGSYSYSKEIIENKLEPAEPSWTIFYYNYFFYFFIILWSVFSNNKKGSRQQILFRRLFLWTVYFVWEMLQLFGSLCEAMRKTSYVFVLDKERNRFHCHICSLEIKYNFSCTNIDRCQEVNDNWRGWMYFHSDEGRSSRTIETIF